MERLPYIDVSSTTIAADRERTWAALVAVLPRIAGAETSRLPAWALRPTPSTRAGDWTADVRAGATLPGFAVEEATRPRRLGLHGSHRFSSYRLVFELDDADPGQVRLSAKTWAAFPGALGRIYRALIIGTGGHRLVVGGILRRVARGA